ncbi:MAG: glycerol-3-phosphate dehydrogenase/oxidase [Deltaproteobacteria bacterium]
MPDPDREVDLAVVGGGITGSAVARDAALRGLSVALFEQGDFSSGTTSRSSRLIHGGLRYLEGFHIGLVRESLRERDWLFRRLPHLLRPLPILMPVYREDGRGMLRVRAGMLLYGLLARRSALPRPATLPVADTLRRVPGLRGEGLLGGALFHDYQLPVPERLVIENLLSAVEGGRVGGGERVFVRNYARVTGIDLGKGGCRLAVRDERSGRTETVSARLVVNATGPWTDRTRRLAGLRGDLLFPTKGIHLVLPGPLPHALFVASPRDGRMFFLLPFGGDLLLGTTDTAFSGDPGAVEADPEEIAYLERGSLRVLPDSPLFSREALYAYAGVRPLLAGRGKTESRMSRKHKVFREGPAGRFLSVAGGKLTTFRAMARDAVDLACRILGRGGGCATGEFPFPGEIGGGPEGARAFVRSLVGIYGTEEPLCAHLTSLYGRRAARVLEIARSVPGADRRLAPGFPDIAAQAILAVREEWAQTPEDVLLRRGSPGIRGEREGDARVILGTIVGGEPGIRSGRGGEG